MHLPARRTFTLRAQQKQGPARTLDVHEPSVGQIEAMLALEPDEATANDEPTIARVRRSMRQCRLLLDEPAPATASPLAWWAWWRQRRRQRAFISALGYGAFSAVYQLLQLSTQGIDLDSIEALADAAQAARKKKAPDLTPPTSSTTSASCATSSPTTSGSSPA